MKNSIPVVHVGLGPLGIRTLQLMAQRPALQLVGAVDVRPDLVGQDVSTLTGHAEYSGVAVTSTLPPAPRPGLRTMAEVPGISWFDGAAE